MIATLALAIAVAGTCSMIARRRPGWGPPAEHHGHPHWCRLHNYGCLLAIDILLKVMPPRTAALLILTGFALATVLILATEAPAQPAPAAPRLGPTQPSPSMAMVTHASTPAAVSG